MFKQTRIVRRGYDMSGLDETDIQILEILKQDGRCSYAKIANIVHMSRVAVRNRINQLTKSGIIAGFTVQISSKAYNKNVSVFLDIVIDPSELTKVAKQMTQYDDIAIVSQHTGSSGLHVHAYFEDMDQIIRFIEDKIYTIKGVRKVETYILIKHYKTNAFIV